jgi:hypothetical protein
VTYLLFVLLIPGLRIFSDPPHPAAYRASWWQRWAWSKERADLNPAMRRRS